MGSIAGKFLYPTVVIEYRIKIGRDKECFPIKGKQTIIDLGPTGNSYKEPYFYTGMLRNPRTGRLDE